MSRADVTYEQERQMSNDMTQNLPNGPSFEERVFARFDSLDAGEARIEERQERVFARLDVLDARMTRMETRLDEVDQRLQVLENRTYDTKPIWERALAEILDLREDVHTLDRKFNIVHRDLLTLQAEQTRLEDRMDKIDSKPA
jgi:chromosome segregation ATPase